MELHQLKTFVVVAEERSITRASERLHLSQPAVSAHIKAIEETVGLALFERTPRGMSLTSEGQRLLVKAEQTLAAHRELLEEAARIKGRVTGRLRLGTATNASSEGVGRLLIGLAERYPEVEVALQHGTSAELLAGLRSGGLDAGFYNEAGEPDPALTTFEVGRFDIYLVAPPGLLAVTEPVPWDTIAALPWIGPSSGSCCGRAAENLWKAHELRPARVVHVDRESVTRTLIAGGVGVGLLHADAAHEAQARGEGVIVCVAQRGVRVLFAHLATRDQDPLVSAVRALIAA